MLAVEVVVLNVEVKEMVVVVVEELAVKELALQEM
jgi:hypothetical protein